jgi:eukaryotic-like serine/threonine-protein kinase
VSDKSALTDRYVRRRLLGRGAMGEVWLADDQLLHRPVAVKQMRAAGDGQDRTNLDRIVREARLAARLSHPNAVGVFDLVIENGMPSVVMEYVAGQTLADHIQKRGRLDIESARSIIGQVAAALAAAHAVGIVHRDVKPSNILITDEGVAKLADFGVARQAGDAALTQTGLVIGTPAYLAPEVAQGAPPSPASDVWSLGATLFAAVEGEPPFPATSSDPLTVLVRIVSERPPPARHGGALQPLIARMLDQEADWRPSAAEAADLLRGRRGADSGRAQGMYPAATIVDAPTQASRPAPAPTTPLDVTPTRRRRPWRWAAVAAGVAILASVAALLLTQQGTTKHAQSSNPPLTPASSSSRGTPSTPASSSPRSTPSTPARSPSHGRTTTSTKPAAANPMTAPAMRQAVQNYYALIPGNLPAAFEHLGPGLRAQGFDAYRAWWSQFSSVSVTPLAADPAAATVTIRLSAVRAGNGGVATDTERLTLITSPDRTHLLINAGQVVSG